MLERLDLRRRTRAAGIHLLISAALAALAAGLVFGLWYPGIFRQVAGGRDLFLLVTGVDVVLGPLLTFAVFNLKKGWRHLRRDLAVIGAIQFAALVYGLTTVYEVRPVAMVFETDRFRTITATQVEVSELPKARPDYRRLPLTGPWLLGAREASPGDERNDALQRSLEGFDRAQRPQFWQPYSASAQDALARARPLSALFTKYPDRADEVKAVLSQLKLDANNARFLPLMGRGGDWVVILDDAGRLVHYLPLDGFF